MSQMAELAISDFQLSPHRAGRHSLLSYFAAALAAPDTGWLTFREAIRYAIMIFSYFFIATHYARLIRRWYWPAFEPLSLAMISFHNRRLTAFNEAFTPCAAAFFAVTFSSLSG